MKSPRPVNLFPHISCLAWLAARGDTIVLKGDQAVPSPHRQRADCHPENFRARSESQQGAAQQSDHRALQIFVLAKTSTDEAPESDEAWPMAQILVWA